MPISSSSCSKLAVLVLLLAVLAVVVVQGATPAEVCLRKLEKYCRAVMEPEQCKQTTVGQTFRALADCCSGSCSKEEILQACCF